MLAFRRLAWTKELRVLNWALTNCKVIADDLRLLKKFDLGITLIFNLVSRLICLAFLTATVHRLQVTAVAAGIVICHVLFRGELGA